MGHARQGCRLEMWILRGRFILYLLQTLEERLSTGNGVHSRESWFYAYYQLGRKVVNWKCGALEGKLVQYVSQTWKGGLSIGNGSTPGKVDPVLINKLTDDSCEHYFCTTSSKQYNYKDNRKNRARLQLTYY